MKQALLSAAALIFVFAANAADTAAPAMPHEKAKDLPECSDISKQCESKGFVVGDHKDKKGLWADCIHAIAKGKKVDGVTATPEQAKACQQAAAASRKAKAK